MPRGPNGSETTHRTAAADHTGRPPHSAVKGFNVASTPAGTLYRGREGMWSWVAHRTTGVVIFFFLFVHVLDTALVRVSPQVYNDVIETYKNPLVGLLEVGLVGAVLFHAFNGLRLVLVDFWAKGPRYQRQMFWGVVGLWVVLMVPFMVRHLGNVLGAG
jgi:succinate dehydrogenase / fumarate reductase, cytochrome b subunit